MRLIEAVRSGNTHETQASITAWGEGQKAVRSVAKSLGTNLVLQNAVQIVFEQTQRCDDAEGRHWIDGFLETDLWL